jgi:putative acetyltransferase
VDKSTPINIAIEDPDQPDVRAMLSDSDAYMASLYPAESNHLMSVFSLQATNVRFLVARRNDVCLACGAVVVSTDGSAEIKRMWVVPDARSHELGRRVLATLTDVALNEGSRVIRVETGISQVEALNLFRTEGFSEIAAFGDYRPDSFSVFMEKRLD